MPAIIMYKLYHVSIFVVQGVLKKIRRKSSRTIVSEGPDFRLPNSILLGQTVPDQLNCRRSFLFSGGLGFPSGAVGKMGALEALVACSIRYASSIDGP
jgi:hypothetical protein